MRIGSLVGNLFLLDKQIKVKNILIPILITLFVAFSKFILEQRPIIENFSIKEFMYMLLGISLFSILIKSKLILTFFKKYFSFNWVLFTGIFFEITLFMTVIYTSKGSLYGWILGFFWLFSGILSAVIQFSKAIFLANIEDYLEIIQIFAYSRGAYFAITIILISNLFQIPNKALPWLIYIVLIFVLMVWFILNLYPYMVKNQNVKNVIELIRCVKNRKRIKINQLKNLTNFSDSYFNKIISRLVQAKFLEIKSGKVELGKVYKYIYRGN